MSLVNNFDKLSAAHSCFAAWNAGKFLLSDGGILDGHSLTYPPFAAGTSLTLAFAPSSVRIGHAIVTMMLNASELGTESIARAHFGASLAYLSWKWWTGDIVKEMKGGSKDGSKEPIPLYGRIFSGVFGALNLGVPMYFFGTYFFGDYSSFIYELLSTVEKVPSSALKKEFLREVFAAGSSSVFGVNQTVSSYLLRAVIANDAESCAECLKLSIINLGSQVVLHTIGYLADKGGLPFKHYMYVHGPYCAPTLGLFLAALYLSRPKGGKDGDKKSK